jgi:hypothetical protein
MTHKQSMGRVSYLEVRVLVKYIVGAYSTYKISESGHSTSLSPVPLQLNVI